VVFYDVNGREMQAFDYSSDPEARDFSSCCFNPSGDTAVVGAFNRFYVYSLSSSRGTWKQVDVKQVRCAVQCAGMHAQTLRRV
jgi:intraflagellar transport protein 172